MHAGIRTKIMTNYVWALHTQWHNGRKFRRLIHIPYRFIYDQMTPRPKLIGNPWYELTYWWFHRGGWTMQRQHYKYRVLETGRIASKWCHDHQGLIAVLSVLIAAVALVKSW